MVDMFDAKMRDMQGRWGPKSSVNGDVASWCWDFRTIPFL